MKIIRVKTSRAGCFAWLVGNSPDEFPMLLSCVDLQNQDYSLALCPYCNRSVATLVGER